MDTLERVHIRITQQQRDFVTRNFGNLSQWVRTRIDREIGAMEATGPHKNDQPKVLVWKGV